MKSFVQVYERRLHALFTRRPMSLLLRSATPFTYELNYYTLHPPAAIARAMARKTHWQLTKLEIRVASPLAIIILDEKSILKIFLRKLCSQRAYFKETFLKNILKINIKLSILINDWSSITDPVSIVVYQGRDIRSIFVSFLWSGFKFGLDRPLAKCASVFHQWSEIGNFPPALQARKSCLSKRVGQKLFVQAYRKF